MRVIKSMCPGLLAMLCALGGCANVDRPAAGPLADPASVEASGAAAATPVRPGDSSNVGDAGMTGEAAANEPPAPQGETASPWPRGLSADLYNASDTWGRLRRGFALPPLDHPLAEQHAQRLARQRFLQRRAERLRLYLPLIVSELQVRDLPLELALLPLVESSLNPHAESPVGALGPWQFMLPTARRFELRSSRLVDDRKNLLAATRAAMDYLGKLHGQFGDWHLAMAAYNWGEGRVQGLVNQQRAAGGPVSFDALAARMPPETRNYVPQIDALRRLIDRPDLYASALPELPDVDPPVPVALVRDTDLQRVLQWSGLDEHSLLALNPAVRRPLVLAAATPQLLMPAAAAARFQAAQAAHRGAAASWSVVRLPATRAVEQIAVALGASADALRQANRIPPGMKPVVGSVLLLPVAPQGEGRADEATVAQAHLQVVPDLVKVQIRAARHETLADVARRCAVDLPALAGWNDIGRKRWRSRLAPGQTLVIWVLRERAPRFAAAAGAPAPAPGLRRAGSGRRQPAAGR